MQIGLRLYIPLTPLPLTGKGRSKKPAYLQEHGKIGLRIHIEKFHESSQEAHPLFQPAIEILDERHLGIEVPTGAVVEVEGQPRGKQEIRRPRVRY